MFITHTAGVAELADALGSGPSGAKHPVEVRVLSPAFILQDLIIAKVSRQFFAISTIYQSHKHLLCEGGVSPSGYFHQ